MPTLNPRINVTLSPSLDALVAQFAKLQRVSKSSVLREFLEAVEPQMRQEAALMEAAKGAKPNALKAVARDMENVVQALEGTQAMAMRVAAGSTRDLVSEAQAVRGRRPSRATGTVARGGRRRSDPPSSNRGVK